MGQAVMLPAWLTDMGPMVMPGGTLSCATTSATLARSCR